ncbi:MAG: CDP-alcohol phosphatidyltransferase family protein [Oscillospiraceae bacterium]|nr:CDP-alcohol phosphatidyltransferase family protein [Oscillospiraceae bacterium]
MKFIKYVPNTLSVLRVLLAALMCVLAWRGHTWWFIAVFFMVGATDFWDGIIARKFNVETKLGSQLDLIGDFAMLIGGVVSVLLAWVNGHLVLSHNWTWFVIAIALTAASCAVPVCVCRARFGMWNKLHLLFYRFIGLPLFLLAPLFIWLGQVNFWLVLAFCILIVLGQVEEVATLLTMKEFHANHNGIIGKRVARKEIRGH